MTKTSRPKPPQLTRGQRQAATNLRGRRPIDLLVNTAARLAWYEDVKRTGREVRVPERCWPLFCDRAGVPS